MAPTGHTPDTAAELQQILKLTRSWLRDGFSAALPVQQTAAAIPAAPRNPAEELENLKDRIAACHSCGLAATRTQTVPGEGPAGARLMLIGEGPGFNEDRQGRPFVGNAGQLLDKMFAAIGLTRQELFIANIIKCRPPENRDPLPEETDACRHFIDTQIDIIRPAVICTLGKIALRVLTGETGGITTVHGRWYSYRNIPLFPLYHPAFLLRQESRKREAWHDLQELQRFLREPGIR